MFVMTYYINFCLQTGLIRRMAIMNNSGSVNTPKSFQDPEIQCADVSCGSSEELSNKHACPVWSTLIPLIYILHSYSILLKQSRNSVINSRKPAPPDIFVNRTKVYQTICRVSHVPGDKYLNKYQKCSLVLLTPRWQPCRQLGLSGTLVLTEILMIVFYPPVNSSLKSG